MATSVEDQIDTTKFGKRTHVQLRCGDEFVPTVIELADEAWFNERSDELLADVEATVARVLQAKPTRLTGVASGQSVTLRYTLTARPPPFTLLVPATGGFVPLSYCGYALQAKVAPRAI